MSFRPMRFPVVAMAAAAVALVAASVSAAAGSSSIQVISDSQLQAMTTTVGGVAGAPSLNTSTTVPHWYGTTVNGSNGVTYGYNMVGADPNKCPGPGCSVTIEADITPVIVNFGGRTFNGSDVLAATLASPQFAANDYGSTLFATAPGTGDPNHVPPIPGTYEVRGSGGALSQGDAGTSLQLEDATMRAQFNQTGSSTYHLILNPNVKPAVTIDVPSTQGVLAISGRGVIFPLIKIGWWVTRIQNLITSADPTHLPIYLTNNVLLSVGTRCCVIGFHGAGLVPGRGAGSTHGSGKQPVQTYAWATYLSPGIYARPNGGSDWAVQDIHPLSHEVAEWADDPFVNNFVEPWVTPTAPQYGCTTVMETGDPVVGIGFAMGTNTFEQTTNPNGSQSADGFYHPEDEALLPWFMRTAPNTISEPTQKASTNIGRYTFMGDLNPFPGFRQPATGC
jgi:hypothetical protein